MENSTDTLIELKNFINRPGLKVFFSVFRSQLERMLSIDKLNNAYDQVVGDQESRTFFHACLKILEVSPNVSLTDLSKIPASGPVVVVANHPFGGLDGIVLAAILSEVRDDIKILGNFIIQNIPAIHKWNIPVDPFGNKESIQRNSAAIRAAINWVKQGGLLITFPAGEVSHLFLSKSRVVDMKWSPHTAAIIRHCRATTVPVYFPGRNSNFFQLMGMFNPRLRTLLLPRELIGKHSTPIEALVGKPIPWSMLEHFQNDTEITNYIRTKTYFLRNRIKSSKEQKISNKESSLKPVIPAIAPGILEQEIGQLPENQALCKEKEFYVYIARADQIPKLMQEIGRLRELTFREVNEGTGKSVDLDRYDDYYHHIVLWNTDKKEVIGAYRIGLSGEILKDYGPKGFYTNSLFRLKPAGLKELGNFIELGRSFIRIEYQKQYSMLLLLWKGIAQFIIRNPQYKNLYGPVSISNDYNVISKNLIYNFFRNKHGRTDLSKRVKPRQPFRPKRIKPRHQKYLYAPLKDIEDVSILISEIEKDGKGIPVLLRHYMKLNAKLLSFNVDEDFSSVLDGLILVDLTETNGRYLKRFMGNEGYNTFTKYHQLTNQQG